MNQITAAPRRALGRLAIAASAIALGVAATGCNVDLSPYAATVGPQVISRATLDADVKAIGNDAGFRCLLERATGTTGYRLFGAGTDTYDSEFVAYVLTNLIDTEIAQRYVASHHLTATSSARTLANEELDSTFTSELQSDGCGTTSAALVAGLGRSLADDFADLQLDEVTIAAVAAHVTLTDAGLGAYEAANPATTRQSCIEGLFVKTAADGAAAASALRHGHSIASVISKYALGQSNSGSLGCYTRATLRSIEPALERSVAATPVGKVATPVSFDGAYLVVEVTSRPFEPVLDALSTLFTSEEPVFSSAISAASRRATVAVDPAYGRWETGAATSGTQQSGFGGRVVPASGPAAGLELNAAANEGPLSKASTAVSTTG